MITKNHDHRNPDTTPVVRLEPVESPLPQFHENDLVARQNLHELPWHAVVINSIASYQNQPVGTRALRHVRGPCRRITNLMELYDQVHAPLLNEMSGKEDSPRSLNELVFVKRIRRTDLFVSTPPLPLYRQGKRFYQRITDQREIDEMLIKYIYSKKCVPRPAVEGGPM